MSRIQPISPTSPEFKGILELNIIYEAGLDSESRPILILCADNLPDPKAINYNLILGDEFVESDYVLVFFSSPAKFRPSWLWLLQAYRSLDRKYKKNLKALYVLHLTKGYRIIFNLANKITSPKFAKKLHYLSSLGDLHSRVPISPNFIPQSVVRHDRQLAVQPSVQKTREVGQMRPVPLPPSLAFGRTLEDLARIEGNDKPDGFVPRVVRELVEHLRIHGIDKEGLFRKSPSSKELRTIKDAFNRGESVDLGQCGVEVSASLLKVFIRELPEPLISIETVQDIGFIPESYSTDQIEFVKAKIEPTYVKKPFEAALLKYLLAFLRDVSENSDKNLMTIHNLAVVFTPNLIRVAEKDKEVLSDTEDAEKVVLYLHQMNQGIGLVRLLINERDRPFGGSSK
ncbi:Rho GTPase activation protein [Phycomyces nitens]|nr:Rho GTPase activation protein [Phycomyces nitens]